jgi:hypothetical protein
MTNKTTAVTIEAAAQWNRSHLWDGISQKTLARGFRTWM